MLNCEKRACPKRSPSVRVQSSTALLRPLVWFRNRVVTRVLGIVPPRVDDGRGAHDAGLERHVERGVREAVRAELPTARPQGLDLPPKSWTRC